METEYWNLLAAERVFSPSFTITLCFSVFCFTRQILLAIALHGHHNYNLPFWEAQCQQQAIQVLTLTNREDTISRVSTFLSH